ncbi:hypothetical protein V1525DRAFT_414242 [Lipomyces kononenkoae]|uniref:Uncharacterized protein n=1 Tax=Lipomyces kononenkoae TaxID=34357 RepID=A0ACC3SR35_LIPKO
MIFQGNRHGHLTQGNELHKEQDSSDDSEDLAKTTKQEAPPSYNLGDPGTSLTKLNLDQPAAHQPPSVDQCVAHLKLLTAFANLREDISTSESLFGLSDSLAEKLTDEDKKDVLPKIREKRWQVYVSRAVDRFGVWWEKCLPSSRMLQQQDLTWDGHFDSITDSGRVINWSPDRFPPLDVLMVLHSFMLNPRAFFEDSIRQGKMDVWATGLPWAQINDCINNSSFDYVVTDEVKSNFEQITGLAWDNLHDAPSARVLCPRGHPIDCPWTDAVLGDPKRPFEQGTGYADRSFTATCAQCNLITNHEILKLQKFRRDLQFLLKDDVPMPGTILSLEGKPEKAPRPGFKRHEMFFPNRLIIAGLKILLIEVTDNTQVGTSTVKDIRDVFDRAIRDVFLVRKANDTIVSGKLFPKEKVAIRRVMSRYWDNWSPFALDLVGAVMRQGTFVEKMANIDWINSPALASTMARLIKKYETFFLIMAKYPDHVAVPTLDVDLAWHTHQLSPRRYYSYSLAKTNIFIDHDDKIEESKLSDAFKWTSRVYQKLTGGQIYSECTCWYCEAIRESHTSTTGRLFSSSDRNAQSALDQLHDNPGVSSDPNKNAHISAHNAVKSDSAATNVAAGVKAAQLQASYQKACRRAKKRGREPPNRDDYMFTYYAWGYPLFYPGIYAPYMAPVVITGDMYPCNPSYISVTQGAAGNCCQGTCSAGVAAGGSCGGSSGACVGGSAGK